MMAKLDDLLAEISRLSHQDRARLLTALTQMQASEANAARDPTATPAEPPAETHESESMTLVTLNLPDDLAQQAYDAGLLAGSSFEQLIRRALQERPPPMEPLRPRQKRKLVLENGFLVVESLPGEKPITFEEVRRILNTMEW